jgi:hypothetical protein
VLKNSFVLYSGTRTMRKSTQNICVWGLIVNQLTANQELDIHFIRLSQFKLFVIYILIMKCTGQEWMFLGFMNLY